MTRIRAFSSPDARHQWPLSVAVRTIAHSAGARLPARSRSFSISSKWFREVFVPSCSLHDLSLPLAQIGWLKPPSSVSRPRSSMPGSTHETDRTPVENNLRRFRALRGGTASPPFRCNNIRNKRRLGKRAQLFFSAQTRRLVHDVRCHPFSNRFQKSCRRFVGRGRLRHVCQLSAAIRQRFHPRPRGHRTFDARRRSRGGPHDGRGRAIRQSFR